jgi:RHS repeat-associated protein
LPFGETLAEQKATGAYSNVYKFTGKELDAETGLYYLGARYYSPVDGIFLSVDPLAEQMPAWSPFSYSFNNPVRFIDPDGRAPDDIILRGANNSSITIKTDLIDIEVNAGGIVGDLGGNYSFEGEDILVAGLDIVGMVDPTPISDALSASIEAKNGNYGGAVLSGLGVIPYVGDLGKVGKIGKHVKTINKAIDGIKESKLAKKLPALDKTGKVHGELPSPADLSKYGREDLKTLKSDLEKSVQKRIEVTSKKGRDRAHGQRQGAEQDLIKSIEKHLENN